MIPALALVIKLVLLWGVTVSGWITGAHEEIGFARSQDNARTTQPEAEVQAAGEQTATPEITDADSLLRALETAGDDLDALSAEILYVKTFSIQGDTQERHGKLVFVSDRDATEDASARERRFAVTFERLVLDGGRRIEDPGTEYTERYVFDGEWLAEIQPLQKRFVRRQVVPPGQSWDPLRVGEGPFPIPIQQRRDVILQRFEAELLDGREDLEIRSAMGVAQGCYQLRLTPRPDIGEDELKEVRVWYDRETLLPRIARTMNRAEDVSFVLLRRLQLDDEADIATDELSTEPPADTTGWEIAIEPYASGRG